MCEWFRDTLLRSHVETASSASFPTNAIMLAGLLARAISTAITLFARGTTGNFTAVMALANRVSKAMSFLLIPSKLKIAMYSLI